MSSQKTKLAVILPSRGLIFSKTAEELLRELKDIDHRMYFAHSLPLPDAFNVPTEQALKDTDITHFLYCEEDLILPKGILKKMLKADYPVVALDYPFKQDDEATTLRDPKGYAFFTGTGFLLAMKVVLEKLPKPVWRTDVAWDTRIKRDGIIEFWPRKLHTEKAYGLHDVNFGLTLYSNNLPIMVMNEVAGQRKLVKRGQEKSNDGRHTIKELTKVLPNNITKNAPVQDRQKFLDAMKRLTGVNVRTTIPDDIEYKGGQAVQKGGKYEII